MSPGTSLTSIGHSSAKRSYRWSLALKPDFGPAHNNLGNSLRLLDRPAEALTCCERAVELDPGNIDARHNRGNVLKELGRFDEALAAYDQEALAADMESLSEVGRTRLHFALAKAYGDLARPDDAFPHLTGLYHLMLTGLYDRDILDRE
jgi:Flp pilus assembly protein TadD